MNCYKFPLKTNVIAIFLKFNLFIYLYKYLDLVAPNTAFALDTAQIDMPPIAKISCRFFCT